MVYSSEPIVMQTDEYGRSKGATYAIGHIVKDKGHKKIFTERDSASCFLRKIHNESQKLPFSIVDIKFDSLYPIPHGLPKKDSIELTRGYDDLYDMKHLQAPKK